MSSASLTLTAQCLCKAQTFTAPVSPSDLPLRASCCHCDSCRHVTGALYTCDAPWPGPATAIRASSLRHYAHSPRVGVLFCGRCSSPMFFEEKNSKGGKTVITYGVFTGVLNNAWLDDAKRPVVQIVDHIFVGDTIDGGASCWLRRPGGDGTDPARLWLGRRGESEEVVFPRLWPAVEALPAAGEVLGDRDGDGNGNVPVRCHCGGVDLVLRAGEARRENAERAAHTGGRRGESGGDDGGVHSRIVDPETHKGLGTFDACDSCRLAAGTDLFHWTFPYLRHISFAKLEPGFPASTTALRAAVDAEEGQGRDARLGTLAYYASSPDVQRYFCSRCSASVFYTVDQQPQMVDLAIGLLHSPDGARAEGIISWSLGGKLTHRADMLNGWRESLLEAVEDEAEAWRIARGYPKCWKRVKLEEREAMESGAN